MRKILSSLSQSRILDYTTNTAAVGVAIILGMFWREYQAVVVWAYCHVVGGR